MIALLKDVIVASSGFRKIVVGGSTFALIVLLSGFINAPIRMAFLDSEQRQGAQTEPERVDVINNGDL